ncbi:Transposon Tf2-9 polyprotein, partial [Choanephora cucurbitarum]
MKNYVTTCVPCQLYGNINNKPKAKKVVTILRLFEQFSIDFVGPFPESTSGNKYIIVAVENFTRWPLAQACKKADAHTVANFIYEHIFVQFGPPTHLLSDNGAHFDNDVVEKFLHLLKIHHKFTSPYRPETNGMCERLNGTITQSLKKLSIQHPSAWDLHLPGIIYAYRTKAHGIIKISPFELLYGQPPRAPRQDALQ